MKLVLGNSNVPFINMLSHATVPSAITGSLDAPFFPVFLCSANFACQIALFLALSMQIISYSPDRSISSAIEKLLFMGK